MKKQKFRPVLTIEQINHICSLCLSNPSKESTSVIDTLGVFRYKIENGLVFSAYVQTKERVNLESAFSLGDEKESRYIKGEMTQEERIKYETELLGPI